MAPPPFTTLEAIAAPFDIAVVDTDQIIPVRFIRTPRARGYGPMLFHDLRYDESGCERPDFVLNQASFRAAGVLVADSDFGTGSSREQAVWALVDRGIRCVLAGDFGDIFFNNAINHGLLLIRESREVLADVRAALHRAPGTKVAVDLDQQLWGIEGSAPRRFEIEAPRRRRLILGLDEIEMTRQLRAEIDVFDAAYRRRRSWLF